jgi:glucokinase
MTVSVVGVDLGGTKVAAAALRGSVIEPSVLRPTELTSTAGLVDQLVELVHDSHGGRLDGVGIGVPSVVEFKSGRVVSSVNVPLADVPLRQVLGERLGVPVFVDNDATVAALAEAHDEQLRLVARNLVMLTIGTGVGGGIIIHGRIYRGSIGGAAELGHTIVGLDLQGENAVPHVSGFPQPGSLESVAAGHALDRLATEAARLYPDSALGRVESPELLGPDAVRAAQEGDPTAMRIVEIWGERVGIGVANAINTFDPDEVVIGGGAALAGNLLLAPAIRVAEAYAHPGLRGHTTIRLARHGVRAGVLGAALLAVHELGHSSVPAGAGTPAGASAPATESVPSPASEEVRR